MSATSRYTKSLHPTTVPVYLPPKTFPPLLSLTDFSAAVFLSRLEIDPLDLSVGTAADLDCAISPGNPTSLEADVAQTTVSAPPAGEEEASPRANEGQSTLPATALPVRRSTDTPEAESGAVLYMVAWIKIVVEEMTKVKIRAETADRVPALSLLGSETAPSTPTPSTSLLGSTPLFAATPVAEKPGTPTSAATGASTAISSTPSTSSLGSAPSFATTSTDNDLRASTRVTTGAPMKATLPAGLTEAEWEKITAPILALTKVLKKTGITNTAVAAENIRPLAVFDERLSEAFSILKLEDETRGEDARLEHALPVGLTEAEWEKITAPILALTKVQKKTDITDPAVAAENTRPLAVFDEILSEAFSILKLDDETGVVDARLERVNKHALPVGLTEAEWEKITAPILALTKVQKKTDITDTAVAVENIRPLAVFDERLSEAFSILKLDDETGGEDARLERVNKDALPVGLTEAEWEKITAPILALTKVQKKTDITDTAVAAENTRPLAVFDERLSEAFSILTLDDETGGEDARLERVKKHADKQERLQEALEMETSNPSVEKKISTSTKVNDAFSGWFNLLTLESPATPCEQEARFLERVTVQTAVRQAISAMATDKRAEGEKLAAAAREEKLVAMEVRQREAAWVARAEAQAKQQAQVEREEEEAKAAAAREQQRVDQQAAQAKEAAIRRTLAEVKRRRAARIRRTALSQVREARDDRRSLSFPCSLHLRSMWRQGELA